MLWTTEGIPSGALTITIHKDHVVAEEVLCWGPALPSAHRGQSIRPAGATARMSLHAPITFRLNQEFLQDLGFGQEDCDTNVRDLQRVLATLHEFTWHWDRSGPLSPHPGHAVR